MKIAIVTGSARLDAESTRVGKWLAKELKELRVEVGLIHLHKLKLTFNPNEFWDGNSEAAKSMAEAYRKLEDAQGLVLVSPEWGGAASPAIKQFILMSGSSMAFKPTLLAGVSATRGGIRPIEDLKSCFKNSHNLVLPEWLVFQNVSNLLKNEDPTEEADQYIQARSRYALKLLIEFTKATQQIREGDLIDLETYPFGM